MAELIRKKDGQVEKLISTWLPEDIDTCFENRISDADEPSLTDSEIEDVMISLVENFDANYGINWDIIEANIEDIIANREEK